MNTRTACFYTCSVCGTDNVQIKDFRTSAGFCNSCNENVKLVLDCDEEKFIPKKRGVIKFRKESM